MKPVSSQKRAGNQGGPRSGFSIVEAIGTLIVFGILMGALTYGMSSLFTQQAQPEVTFGQQTYARAPSFENFHNAIDLHTAFTAAVDQADSIIVLGGIRSHPVYDPTGPSSALGSNFSDSILSNAVDGDGAKAYSSWDQLQVNASQFSPYLTTNPDPADFTILTVQGLCRITSITQQRRYQTTINGQVLSLYEVTHQTIDWSSGSPVLVTSADTGTNPTHSYRFYYAASEDVWALPPGATHYWYRSDSAWHRDQEGPSRVIFADPYTTAGQDAASPLNPASRFAYFLSQLR